MVVRAARSAFSVSFFVIDAAMGRSLYKASTSARISWMSWMSWKSADTIP